MYAQAASHSHPRQSEDTDFMEEGSGGFNQSTTPVPAPILSPSAIANIISAVLAVVFLTVVLCYLMRSFNQGERKTRIKTALDNNRRIDEQIAAAKARAEQRTAQTHPIQGTREICTDSLEVIATSVEFRPQDSESHPFHGETLDNIPNSNSSQVSIHHGVNKEVVPAPALSPSRTS